MPELPEVETVRRGLAEHITGHAFEHVTVTGRRTVRRQPPDELVARLTGRTAVGVGRKGKFLAVLLDDGEALVIHLRMSGQVLWVAAPGLEPLEAHTHVVVRLDGGSELRFVDPRTFGEWYITDDVDPSGLPADFSRLGPDPILDGLRASVLREQLNGRRVALKAALTDQRVVAGIGSIYADEICFASKLRPDRRTETLSRANVTSLARNTRRILINAIELRGSSLKDERYRDLMGELGTYQLRHRVYGRAGQRCFRCGATVAKVAFGARTAYCCEACQR